MAELENSKYLISVLWSGADILRSKMDANEYKDYLLGKSKNICCKICLCRRN